MLLPSALSCEFPSAQPNRATRSSSALYVSPPTSPPTSTTASALMSTCRALHSMLSSSPSPQPSQLPTPPMSYAPAPNASRLRLRARKPTDSENTTTIQRRRITKRALPRGINKRRRAIDDLDCSSDEECEDEDNDNDPNGKSVLDGPRTPKRARISPLFPEVLPLGLERGDFWSLQNQNQDQTRGYEEAHEQHQFSSSSFSFTSQGGPAFPSQGLEFNAPGPLAPALVLEPAFGVNRNHDMIESGALEPERAEWTSEEDRVLVELVLEKLKLTKSEWQDCARSLGRDRGSVGRRWRSLVGAGEVGMKRRGVAARKGIHATWR